MRANAQRIGTLKLKVLVAEDEPEMLRSYRTLLEDLGFDVVTARDGQACLDAYRRGGFDLVILDYKIPRKNGMKVAKEIAAVATSQEMLMITAYAGIIDPEQKPEKI